MSDSVLHVYQFLLGYLLQATQDITEEELDAQPVEGANPPRWIMGHLAICCDYAMKQMGGATLCPKDWHASFGPGSTPGGPGAARPSKEELVDMLKKGHAAVIEKYSQVDPATLAAPHGIEFLSATPLKTKQDLLTHLMTSHEAGHMGQLTYWRRATGRKAFF